MSAATQQEEIDFELDEIDEEALVKQRNQRAEKVFTGSSQ
jgi:hypothetical protein